MGTTKEGGIIGVSDKSKKLQRGGGPASGTFISGLLTHLCRGYHWLLFPTHDNEQHILFT